ncbi:MAG TPA: response regulator [Terriglobales bacterium]|nr:response regulator [Terriglobales bacterium]
MKILLADDSVTAQNMGKKILSEAGHEVVTVSNGAAAAKKIAEIKPELVLLDVFMPGYSGLELCERLRNAAETSKLPVLLTVGRMEPYSPNDGTRVKADGVIVKPFEASDLTAAVDRLAEKIQPKQDARAMKIVPRQDSKAENAVAPQDDRNPSGATDAPKAITGSAELPYEKTQRLDRSHIEAVLSNSSASKPEDTAPLMVTPEQEFDMSGPAHSAEVQVESTDQDSQAEQAYLTKPRAESGLKEPERRFAVPSYMTQYLADHPESNVDDAPESKTLPNALVEAAAQPVEEPIPTSPISNDLLHHSQSDVTLDAPVGSATGLEFTAAAPVPDQPIALAPGFEPTLQTSEEPPTIAKDPALVTDLHHASMDFPTRFGAGEPELADFLVQASQDVEKPTAASPDDFEARLSAALSSYEQPSADLPLVTPETETPTAEIPTYQVPEPDSISDAFEAQVAAAMQGFDAPAPEQPFEAESKASQRSPEFEAIEIEPQADTGSGFVPEIHLISSQDETAVIPQEDETSSIEIISDTLTGSVEAESVALGWEANAAPEPDDAVIEQMRSSLSHLPVDPTHTIPNSHPEPMAMAAAAGAVPGASLSATPDPEVARAIAAALAQEALADVQATEIPVAAPASDANHLAGAVEKVMKQELPSLVWKIMAELDLRKGR